MFSNFSKNFVGKTFSKFNSPKNFSSSFKISSITTNIKFHYIRPKKKVSIHPDPFQYQEQKIN